MTDMMAGAMAGIPAWPIVIAVGLVVGLLLFPEEVRRAARAVADSVRDVLQAVDDLLTSALTWMWRSVRPSNPVKPLPATFGILLLAVAVGASVANYLVLQPTLEILLPFGHASQAVAFVLVAFTGALGALMHFCTRRIASVGVLLCEVALVVSITVLAWLRTMAVQQGMSVDLPDVVLALDYSQPIISTVLTALLQIAEFAVALGAFALAGETLPVLVVAPVLIGFGVGWVVVQIVRRCEVHRVLASLADELANAACAVRAAVGRLLRTWSREARLQRRHELKIKELNLTSEEMKVRSGLDERRDTEAWERGRQATARDAATAHERALNARVMTMELELAEQLAQSVNDNAAAFAAEVMDAARTHVRVEIAKEIALAAPAVVRDVARSAFAAIRPFTYFGTRPRPTDHSGNKTVN